MLKASFKRETHTAQHKLSAMHTDIIEGQTSLKTSTLNQFTSSKNTRKISKKNTLVGHCLCSVL